MTAATSVLRIAIAALASTALAATGVAQNTGDSPPVVQGRGQDETARMADLSWRVAALDGRTFELRELRGRTLFVNVWATWCRPCIAELGSIARLRDSLRGVPVEFVLVAPERRATVSRFVRRSRLALPVYVEMSPIPESYGLAAVPTTFIVAPDGRIILAHRGAARWDRPDVVALVRRVAREASPVRPPSRPAPAAR